jgi:hypothetical protein
MLWLDIITGEMLSVCIFSISYSLIFIGVAKVAVLRLLAESPFLFGNNRNISRLHTI